MRDIGKIEKLKNLHTKDGFAGNLSTWSPNCLLTLIDYNNKY